MSASSTPNASPPKKVAKAKPAAGPKTVDMVVEAITTINDRKGASIQAIKTFILEKYPTVDPSRLRSSLKKAVAKGMESGVIVRPKATEASGASLTGRLKVDKAKLAAQNKEPKPKAPKPVAPKAKKPRTASKSPKKALSKAKKSPGKPKSKTLTKKAADTAKPKKAPAAAAKVAKPKVAKGKEPKKLKAPKTPKTPAKAKAKAKTTKK